MLTEDYIVRMIQDMGRMVARVLGRDISFEDTQGLLQRGQPGDPLPLLEELKRLAVGGKVNDAENRLVGGLGFVHPPQLALGLEV